MRANNVDANQAEIVKCFRKHGVLVRTLNHEKDGLPDLLCCYRGQIFLAEVKDGPKKKLTPDQIAFFKDWAGAPICVIRQPSDVTRLVNVLNLDSTTLLDAKLIHGGI